MKRMVLWMMAALLLMAQGAWAQDATVINGISYLLNVEDKTAEVVDPASGRYTGDIVVPDYVEQDGTRYAVTVIGEGAFMGSSLTSLQLPTESLRIIETLAFSECRGLTAMDIPEGVTTIGKSAFNCPDLKRIHIPASVAKIGDSAIGGSPELEAITIAEGNTAYGVFDGVLMDKAQKNLICYPAKMAGTTYNMPATVTSIDRKAFQYLAFLNTLNIPASVEFIDYNSFYEALSLAEINVDPANTAYCSVDGVVYSADKENLCIYPANKPDEIYTVDAAVKVVGISGFSHARHLQTVIFPEGVNTISDAAFYKCISLKEVSFPESVTKIGTAAFSFCEKLESMVLPPHITEVSPTLFYNCVSLRSVTIPAYVTAISMAIFSECTSLKEITCLATTPPTLHPMSFLMMPLGEITLYVPAESVELYKATNTWKDFNVKAIAPTAEPSQTLTEIRTGAECTVYAFNYPSVSATGDPTVLSSALFVWTPANRQETDSIESLHIFSHITITADDERLTTTVGVSKEQNLLMLLPSRSYSSILGGEQADYVSRCIVIAPDFEGYGVTKDVPHPYLSQRLTAQQMIDGVKYGLALYQKEAKESETLLPMKSDWRSFCIGYSQGGAVSLATHREIEEQGLADELRFQGSICGDGPYDLVTTMRYYLEDDGTSYDVETPHRKGLTTLPSVVSLILKGMFETHPDMKPYKMEDLLSQQLIDTGVLGWIDSKAYTLDNISSKWYDQLQAGVDTLGRHYTPAQMAEMFESPKEGKVWGKMEKMFSPAVYDYMSDTNNYDVVPEQPANVAQALHRALADNSVVTGWEPQHRIQFFHSKADVIVPYGNYLSFRDAHPQGEGKMFRINDTFSNNDHFDAGGLFLLDMMSMKNYGEYFNWLCEGGSTGIRSTDNRQLIMDNSWYTLDGRRLSGKPTQRGIYIRNGEKYILK